MSGMPAEQEHVAKPPAVMPYRHTARAAGIGSLLIGAAGLLGWVLDLPVLSSVVPGLQAIAMSAALAYMVLGLVLYLGTPWPGHRILTRVLLAAAGAIMIFGLLELIKLGTGAPVSLEDAVLRFFPTLYATDDAHITPIASGFIFLIGLGQALYLSSHVSHLPHPRALNLVGVIGILVFLGSLISLLEYLYGTPIVVGGTILPVSGLAALAALLQGIGLVTIAGTDAFPLNQVSDASTQARLLRAFLPLTAITLLLLSLAQFFLLRLTPISPVLTAVVLVTVVEVVVIIIIRQVARTIGGFIDRAVAERRQAEAELRRSEAQLSTIIDNLSEGVIVSTIDGELIHWNRAGLEMHGFATQEEARRRLPEFIDFFELRTLDNMPIAYEQWPLPRILRGETLRDWTVRISGVPLETERIFSYSGSLVRDGEGRPLMAILTVNDVTERQRAADAMQQWAVTMEERVRERTAELETSNRELENFAYTVAHDLRSPLRSVAGFSEYVLKHYAACMDARGQDYLQRMRAAAQRMGQLIDDLLHLARISRAALKRERVNLSELATGIVAGLRERAPERHAKVVIAPGMIVEGDRDLLRQALAHLIDNAWKFTRDRPDADIAIDKMTRHGEEIYYVRDNGIGFAMAHAHALFQPFHRLHTEKAYPGTGIGLAIVQRIVQRHGGRIWVDSAEGQGSTFYFTLGKGRT